MRLIKHTIELGGYLLVITETVKPNRFMVSDPNHYTRFLCLWTRFHFVIDKKIFAVPKHKSNEIFFEKLKMSKNSGTTSEASGAGTWRGDGVPHRCWCGGRTELKLSNSKNNPNRKFFRCSYAATKRIEDENHVFKWMDEAIVSELEILDSKMESLHQELITAKLEMEKIQREFESDIMENVEKVIMDAKTWVMKMVVVLIVCFVVACICFKLLG